MLCGSLGGLVVGASLPIVNVIFGQILDELNGNPDAFDEGIAQLCINFCILGAANFLCGFGQVYCWSATGERQTQKFRERYVNSVLSQEIGWFDTCGASELSTKLAEMIGKVQDGTGRKVGDLIQYVAQFVTAMGVSFYLNWKLSLVLLAAIPVIGVAGAFMITAISSSQQQALEQYAGAGGLASQALNAVRTVTALNMQPGIVSRYRHFLYEAMLVGVRKGVNVGLGNGAVFGSVFLTYALGFWYGGNLVADSLESNCTRNCLTGGEVLAVFFSTIMGSMALGQIAPPLTAFVSARTAVGNILEIVDRKPLIDGLSDEGLKPDVKCRGEIEVDDVCFAYPSRPNLQVCKGYKLHIAPGETVALVGMSGAGKSTLINLLLRFYDPRAGRILLDGYDIKELNIKYLRQQCGYVGQEPVLFAGTIADNIAYGLNQNAQAELHSKRSEKEKVKSADELDSEAQRKREDLMQKVIAAAKLANAHDFIMSFPQGYETDVGSNGVAMSGGQKQRIAIARALIKKPAVLLLDEATSALDASSERIVQHSIDTLAQSKAQTTIIIAHRLSTIRDADKICVLSDGKFVEMGKHEELLARNGIYSDLVKIQVAGGQEEEEESGVVKEELVEECKLDKEETGANVPGVGGASLVEAGEGDVVPVKDASDSKRSGTAYEKANGGEEVKVLSKRRVNELTRKIWGLIFRYPSWLIFGFAGSVLFGAVFPCWGYLLARTQEMFYLPDPDEIRDRARLYAFFYILIAGVAFFSSIFQYGGLLGMGENVSMYLRSEMFEALMRRNIAFFDYEENATGTLLTTLSDDSRAVNKAFGESMAKQVQAIFTLTIALALGLSASWKIGLVVLACFPLSIAASAVQMQAMSGQQYDDDNDANDASNVAHHAKSNADAKATTVAKVGKQSTSNTKNKKASANSAGSTMAGGHGAVIATAFVHMRTVSAFSMHHQISSYYAELTRGIMKLRIKRSIVAGLGFGGSNAVMFLTYALLFWYGAQLIKKDGLRFVDLMTAILTLMLGALGLGQALADLGDQTSALQAADRIFENVEQGKLSPIDGISIAGITPQEPTRGRIELKNVSFRYPTRQNIDVCNGYNLVIEPGETVALVGPSGSGKSTIISLLLRFYDPIEGEVLLDGVNIRDLNVRWLRSQIGYVGQEPVLFKGSVAENVSRGRPEVINEPLLTLEEAVAQTEIERGGHGTLKAMVPCLPLKKKEDNALANTDPHVLPSEEVDTDGPDAQHNNGDMEMTASHTKSLEHVPEDVIEACRLANAHDFITSFPQGYDTDIGEGSIMVSGGQKQRIAIARALIKKPTVLLLDEATSALDANSERVVQHSIDTLAQSKAQTTIIIAHRLTTIRNADRIYVIDKGSIVECGRHDELLAKSDGLYKQLWEKQQGGHNVSTSPSTAELSEAR
jgi:ATP-binding cassette subfamily B (MDR/TAP) protein 1